MNWPHELMIILSATENKVRKPRKLVNFEQTCTFSKLNLTCGSPLRIDCWNI